MTFNKKSLRTKCRPQRRGGDEGDRTLDLTDANRTLSQLSYAPRYEIVVGIELNRPGSQLSYAPMT